MKRSGCILMLLLFLFINGYSQNPIRDRWDTLHVDVATSYVDTFYYYQKGIKGANSRLHIFGDSVDLPNYTYSSFIHSFNPQNNVYTKINYPRHPLDRGISCAAAPYTFTSQTVFFGVNNPYYEMMDNTLVLYKLNSSNNSVTTETIVSGLPAERKGILNMCFFSPQTNHDSLIIFNHTGYNNNDTVTIFKKHINQAGIQSTSIKLPVPVTDIKSVINFNNTLYVAGNGYPESPLFYSTNGITFSVSTSYSNSVYGGMPVLSMDTLGGYLYLVLDGGDGDFAVARTNDGINFSSVIPQQQGWINSIRHHNNMLFFTKKNQNASYDRPDIYYISAPTNTILSVDTLGRKFNDAYQSYLETVNGKLLMSVGYTNSEDTQYGNFIYQFVPPVANFTVSTNNWCLNTPYTLINQSANADSVRWIKDNNFFASTSNTYATSFNSSGSHTIGLIAISGTQKDTLKYTINVYGFTVSVSGPSNLCLNAPSTFSVINSGAIGSVTYALNASGLTLTATGQNSVALSTSVTGTFNYSITATDANNCSFTSINYSIASFPDKDISGTITHNSNAVTGDITLYRFEPVLTKFDSITTVTPNASGQFTFTARKADTYILKGIPTDNTLQVTYAPNAVSWKNAQVLSHGCVNNSSQNITVSGLANTGGGPGVLSGKIVEALGYGQKNSGITAPGNPIRGVTVKGGRNPGGDIVAQSRTNPNGEFSLSDLPLNIAGESYFIIVDIPGLDTSSTYYRSITTGSTQYSNLDFAVDSMMISPLENVSVKEVKWANGFLKIYPNPAQHHFIMESQIKIGSDFSVELSDIQGRRIKTCVSDEKFKSLNGKMKIDLHDVSDGVYIIHVYADGMHYREKLIVSKQ
jgi:hypothetical protein